MDPQINHQISDELQQQVSNRKHSCTIYNLKKNNIKYHNYFMSSESQVPAALQMLQGAGRLECINLKANGPS